MFPNNMHVQHWYARARAPYPVAVEQGARACAVTVRYMNHTRQCSRELVAHRVSTYRIHHNARHNLVPVKLYTTVTSVLYGYLNVLLYYDKFSF